MCLVSVWHLEVCGAVTVLAVLVGFLYTYFRQKGIKSLSEATKAQSDKWSTGEYTIAKTACSLRLQQVRHWAISYKSGYDQISGHIFEFRCISAQLQCTIYRSAQMPQITGISRYRTADHSVSPRTLQVFV